jgi:hypothetical protein
MYEKGVTAGCVWVADKKRFDRRAAWRLSNRQRECQTDETWSECFRNPDAGERFFLMMWPGETKTGTAAEFWAKVGSDPDPGSDFVRGFADGVIESCLDMTF